MIRAISGFMNRLRNADLTALPAAKREAVCILSESQDQWEAGFAAFALAKQAGFDLEFQYADQPLRDSTLYILPSVAGSRYFSIDFYRELMDKVKGGATLYLFSDGAFLSPFEEYFGTRVTYRHQADGPVDFEFAESRFSVSRATHLSLESIEAEVLAADSRGNPVFTKARYGDGEVYFLACPLERHVTETAGALLEPLSEPYYELYRSFGHKVLRDRIVSTDTPSIGITEHPETDDTVIIVAINYRPEAVKGKLALSAGWAISETIIGQDIHGARAAIPANDALVFRVEKQVL